MTSAISNYLYNINNSQSTALTKAMGLHGQWGMSSTFDFLEIYDKQQREEEEKAKRNSHHSEEPIPRVTQLSDHPPERRRLNLLFLSPGDIRHLICSIARSRRYFKPTEANGKVEGWNGYECPEIHFYLLEPNAELMARHLLLFTVFFHLEIPIRQKANLFLEIHGNLTIQKRTRQFINQFAKDLIPLVTQTISSPLHTPSAILLLQQLLSFDLLHFRDLDSLHTALTHYFLSFDFPIEQLLNTRLRALVEDRYDNRTALFDWDYHANYKKTASIIHIKQYKHWRETGIAYEFGDQVYNESNPTFISYTEGIMKKGTKKGEKQEVLGYWGDIVNAPYISFGVNSDSNGNKLAEELYDIINKNTGTEQHRHHAVEVALYNLYSYLWELETGNSYQMLKAHDIYSGLGKEYKRIQSNQIEDLLEELTNNEKEKETGKEEEEEKQKKVVESSDQVEDDERYVSTSANEEKAKEEMKGEQKKESKSKLAVKAEENHVNTDLQSIEQAMDILSNFQEALQHIHIHPIIATNSELLTKSKFKDLFHGVFVSNRFTAILKEKESFQELFMKNSASQWQNILAVETIKYLIPVNQEVKQEYNKKIHEYTNMMAFQPFQDPPVRLRRRDENDLEDDVLFFHQ